MRFLNPLVFSFLKFILLELIIKILNKMDKIWNMGLKMKNIEKYRF